MGLKLGYKQTEVGMVPEDWEVTTVSGIAAPIRNAIVGGPFGSDLVSADYVDDGIPVIRGQNMGSRSLSGNFAFVSPAKADSLEANLARPGDLVFTQRGTLGQVSLVPDRPYDRYLVSQSQMKVTLNRKIGFSLFYYYVFTSSEQQEHIRKNTIQTGVPHTNLGILRGIPVQRPKLHEQEAIAEALSDADALIESLEQLIAKKRHLKQGAMQELLRPKEGDEVRKLCEVSSLKGRIGWQGLKQKEFTTNEDEPFLITGMNFKDGEIQWNEVYHIPEERYELAKDIQLMQADVLMTKDGTIGKVLYIDEIGGVKSFV
jgi:type I restriction enzyme S subunit